MTGQLSFITITDNSRILLVARDMYIFYALSSFTVPLCNHIYVDIKTRYANLKAWYYLFNDIVMRLHRKQ